MGYFMATAEWKSFLEGLSSAGVLEISLASEAYLKVDEFKVLLDDFNGGMASFITELELKYAFWRIFPYYLIVLIGPDEEACR